MRFDDIFRTIAGFMIGGIIGLIFYCFLIIKYCN